MNVAVSRSEEPVAWLRACHLSALIDGAPHAVDLGGVAVCLVRLGAELFAVHDECTHEAVALSEGDVEGCTIECWRHGSRFDLRTGMVMGPPAVEPVQVYATRVEAGEVFVNLPG
jgi:3-phenylpropionate/trans-cinnamate dioxygenase ferredoxin subunit